MNKFFLNILILCLFYFTLLFSEEVAIVTKNNGNTKYKNFSGNLLKNKVNPGMELFNKDLLSTGNDGFIMFAYLDDGSLIKVHKNSRVFVNGEIKNNIINKDIIIDDGFIKFDINKQKQNEFKIVTPTSVASVKGTVFYLDSKNNRDIFYGFEGEVEILNLESNNLSNLTQSKKITSTQAGDLFIEDMQVEDIQFIQQLQLESGFELEEVESFDFDDSGIENGDSDNDTVDSTTPIQELVITFTNALGEQKKLIIKYIND